MLFCHLLKIYQWVRRTAVKGPEAHYCMLHFVFILVGLGNFIFIKEKPGNFAH